MRKFSSIPFVLYLLVLPARADQLAGEQKEYYKSAQTTCREEMKALADLEVCSSPNHRCEPDELEAQDSARRALEDCFTQYQTDHPSPSLQAAKARIDDTHLRNELGAGIGTNGDDFLVLLYGREHISKESPSRLLLRSKGGLTLSGSLSIAGREIDAAKLAVRGIIVHPDTGTGMLYLAETSDGYEFEHDDVLRWTAGSRQFGWVGKLQFKDDQGTVHPVDWLSFPVGVAAGGGALHDRGLVFVDAKAGLRIERCVDVIRALVPQEVVPGDEPTRIWLRTLQGESSIIDVDPRLNKQFVCGRMEAGSKFGFSQRDTRGGLDFDGSIEYRQKPSAKSQSHFFVGVSYTNQKIYDAVSSPDVGRFFLKLGVR